MTTVRIDFFSEHARKLAGMPDTWSWFQLERLPHAGECQVFRIRGAIAPSFERGKRKGQTNWKARDKATEREVYITPAQHEEFLRAWEADTGKCYHCQGTTLEVAGWTAAEGTKYRPCPKCGASGKAANHG